MECFIRIGAFKAILYERFPVDIFVGKRKSSVSIPAAADGIAPF
jgi:hypothetical protein